MAKDVLTETRIDPIFITDNETGNEYELDFSRESLKFMAAQEFKVNEEIVELIADKGPALWFYAFRMHHRKMARSQTDALLEKMGGLTREIVERLYMLYNQALMSNNIIQDSEDLEKNSRVTVKL